MRGVGLFWWAQVRSEVPSMRESLMGALRAQTAVPLPEVSVITDGGNGVQHLHRLLPGKVHSILDWFHISMRVRYLEQIVSGLRAGSETESQVKRLLAKKCPSYAGTSGTRALRRLTRSFGAS